MLDHALVRLRKKNVLNNINLIFQVPGTIPFLETTLTGTSNADPQEAMDGLGKLGWMAKIRILFLIILTNYQLKRRRYEEHLKSSADYHDLCDFYFFTATY